MVRLEKRENNSVVYLGTESRTLTVRRDVTKAQVVAAIGHLPPGTPRRWTLAKESLKLAGLTS